MTILHLSVLLFLDVSMVNEFIGTYQIIFFSFYFKLTFTYIIDTFLHFRLVTLTDDSRAEVAAAIVKGVKLTIVGTAAEAVAM